MTIEHLSSRAVIVVSGADAAELLQRVITANVETLSEGIVRDCALLTPQGKVLFQFLISRFEAGFLIDCQADDRDGLMKRLTLYRLRSDVVLEPRDLHVLTSAEPFDGCLEDERARGMGHRAYVDTLPDGLTDEQSYHLRRISAGVPEMGMDYDGQTVFAHEALLDLTHGIDFRKGCYVGQEVVSRVEHRSTARKRFVCMVADKALPERGVDVTLDGKSVGTLGSSAGHSGLALVRVDKLSGPYVEVEGGIATLSVPAFASFSLGAPDDG
ncbi:MAG: folate-binding protein [Pseudomonadota bacterium]